MKRTDIARQNISGSGMKHVVTVKEYRHIWPGGHALLTTTIPYNSMYRVLTE